MTDLGKEVLSSWEGKPLSRENPHHAVQGSEFGCVLFTSKEFANLGAECVSIEIQNATEV